jgi:adenine-specific DNA-methyltransferase
MSYRYLGNKTRLADWIVSRVSASLPTGARIADPMCGTAAVSFAFAEAGFSVIASDALTFPTIHARTRLLAKQPPEFTALGGYRSALEQLNNAVPVEGYFFREFSVAGAPANGREPRGYFTADNARHVDGVRSLIRDLDRTGQLDEVEKTVLLHQLILSTNRVANIAGTYGYFQRTISASAARRIWFEPITFTWTSGNHEVLQGNVEDIVTGLDVDACYLDPPYTKRQYAGNYHVLETLAREDEPEAAGDGGLRPWAEQSSAFCYRRQAPQAFRETLKRLDCEHVFISYSEDGQVAAEELYAILADFGTVALYEEPLARYRSNDRGKSGAVLERLYHVRAY